MQHHPHRIRKFLLSLIFSLWVGFALSTPTLAQNPSGDARLDWVQLVKLTSPEGEKLDQLFGEAVILEGNIAIVSDTSFNDHQGIVYIFQKPTNGPWDQASRIATLTASDAKTSSSFGQSLALTGETLFIAAPNQNNDTGMVYVFEKPASGWADMTETARLTPSDREKHRFFGMQIASDGATFAATNPPSGEAEGQLYIFEKPASGWADMTETVKVAASSYGIPAEFQGSVAIEENSIAIATSQEAVYVLDKPAGSNWAEVTLSARLTASNGHNSQAFGTTLVLDGETLFVGAHQHNEHQGAVYIFEKPTNGWTDMTETTVVSASNGEGQGLDDTASVNTGDGFGRSITVNNHRLFIAAPGDDRDKGINDTQGSEAQDGAVYVFDKPAGGSWANASQTTKLTLAADEQMSLFGVAINSNPDAIIISSRKTSIVDGYSYHTGAAYIFGEPEGELKTAEAVPDPALEQPTLPQPGDQTPFPATFDQSQQALLPDNGELSDFDIDGNTVVFGDWKADNFSGTAYIFEKPTGGKWANGSQVATLTASDHSIQNRFGGPVVIKDDTAFISAYGNGQNAVYIFEKPASGWIDMTETVKLMSGNVGDFFGTSIAVEGDTLVIGAEGTDDNDNNHKGTVYIYKKPTDGSWTNVNQIAQLVVDDTTGFGRSVAIQGDTIVIGGSDRNFISDEVPAAATTYIFEKPTGGSWANATQIAKLVSPSGHVYAEFTEAVALEGDTLYIGASWDNDFQGAVYVYQRPAGESWSKVSLTAKLTASDGERGFLDPNGDPHRSTGDLFGQTIIVSGNRLFVGAMGDDQDKSVNGNRGSEDAHGAFYVFDKPTSGWTDMTETLKLTAANRGADKKFGRLLAIDDEALIVSTIKDNNGNHKDSVYFFE